MRLDGKTALVTGAANGIGRALTERLALAGARVVASDLDGDGAAAVARALGEPALARPLDVADPDAFAALVREIDRDCGLDVLVNNAGIGVQTPLLETEIGDFRRILEVNVLGVFAGRRAAGRAMRARGRGGRIVNVASVAGLRGSTGRIAYGASKAAVINMTQVAAVELAPFGITVNAIAPGPVDTPLTQRMHSAAAREAWARQVPMRRYGTALEIAAAAVYLASDEAAYTTGQVLAVDGGFAAAGLIFDATKP